MKRKRGETAYFALLFKKSLNFFGICTVRPAQVRSLSAAPAAAPARRASVAFLQRVKARVKSHEDVLRAYFKPEHGF